MSLVALDGTPLVLIGAPFARNSEALPTQLSILQDAANEACIMYGHVITDDGGSHTIDTTGSSSLGWRPGAVTFANAGTTFKVGLAAMDTTTGPPGRAVNVADVITFDVSRSYTSGAPPAANTWTESVPTAGTKTIANGDFLAFCTQMTARGGVDLVNTAISAATAIPRPGATSFTGAAYAGTSAVPNGVITFSDGHLGWFYGGAVWATSTTTQTWNNGSATTEYGNFFQCPFPMKIYGLMAAGSLAGDTDFVLYSAPLGTPVAEKTVSADLNTANNAAARYSQYLFASPYSSIANQPLAAIMKPTTATNITAPYKTYNTSAQQVTEMCGTNGYAVNRASGAFAAQNANKDRFAIGLLVGAFDAGGIGITTVSATISDSRRMIGY